MNEEEKKAVEILNTFEFRGKTRNYKEISSEDSKSVKIVLNLLEKLQKENEELKSKNKTLEELLQGNLYELYKYYKELAGTYQGNCISLQKVKDKIEELKQEKKKYGNCLIEMYEDELVNRDIKILQELLEGRK
jgi:hypothetical protein